MKKISLSLILILIGIFSTRTANAQYTSIVNQAYNLLQTAVIGGYGYKGYLDVSYVGGFGNLQADFIGISTTQGYQMASWFYMGAGLGVDIVYSKKDSGFNYNDFAIDRKVRTTGVMIPIFSDFRFNLGGTTGTSFFIDVKAGG